MNPTSLHTTADRNGHPVIVGTRVRVISVPSSVLERVDVAERDRVASMAGETFEVYEVDAWGGAWVEKWWHESEDKASSHSLGLRPAEMEVVPDEV
jgi:hypothetical protein